MQLTTTTTKEEEEEASFSGSFVGEMLGEAVTLVLLPFIALIALKLGEGGRVTINVKLIWKHMATIIRSVLVAVGIGIVPGVGESAACWLGYDLARRRSKNKDNFGKGEVEGVIAAEAANSATSGGALIPSLVFGTPGSGPTALLIAAMFMYGIRPGPMLMLERPGFAAKIVILFWLCAIFSRLGAMLISPTFIRILSSPAKSCSPLRRPWVSWGSGPLVSHCISNSQLAPQETQTP